MTHQTTIIVYRLTDKRIEVFSWKPQIDSVKPVMKWTAIVSGIAVVIASIINPSFIIAGIGPIGIGVMAALMGTSKNYQSMARNQMKYEINWLESQRIYAYRSRNIIGLNIHWFNPDIGETITKSIQPVFVTGDMFDDVLGFFKEKLPAVPVEDSKFVVYH